MIESDPGLKYRLQELFNNLRQGSLRLARLTARKVHARDVQVDNSILVDTIDENTAAAGVTADGVLLKDGVVAIGDVAFDDATSDPVAVGDAAADGTENSVARKDHGHATGGTAGGELGGTYPNPTVDATHSGSAHHAQAHTVASHSDTTATGAETETLTDGSDADALHDHATLITSTEAIAAVEGEATLDLTGDVTIAAAKSLAIDTIGEKTAAAGVTIDGLLLKDEYIELDEIAAPAAPAANKGRVFAKDEDGQSMPYWQSEDGNAHCMAPKFRMRATRDTAQTMVAATFDVIEFATEDYDPFGDYDNATNYNYTVPVTGRYLVAAAAHLTMSTAGKLAMLAIFVNGVEKSRGNRFEAHSAMVAGVTVTDILELTAADTVDIRLYHDEAANKDLEASATRNYFAVHALSL